MVAALTSKSLHTYYQVTNIWNDHPSGWSSGWWNGLVIHWQVSKHKFESLTILALGWGRNPFEMAKAWPEEKNSWSKKDDAYTEWVQEVVSCVTHKTWHFPWSFFYTHHNHSSDYFLMAGALYGVIYDASHTNSIGGNGMVSILSISICIPRLLNNFPSIGYDYRPFFDSFAFLYYHQVFMVRWQLLKGVAAVVYCFWSS